MTITYNNRNYEIDLSARVIVLDNKDQKSVVLYMPGLPCPIQINVTGPHPVWGWNEDVYNPTFTPSILTRMPWGEPQREIVNHVFVRNGQIQYLGDCTHEYRNQIVDLPMLNDWPDEMKIWE